MSREVVDQVAERAQREPAFRERIRTAPRAALAGYDLTEQELMSFILPNFGWLIEGRLAGLARPRSLDALAALRALGVKVLVTLTEEPLPAAVLADHGLEAAHVPVPDYSAPTIEQIEQAITAIDGWLARPVPMAVHCAAGLGRTGTILACYLVRHGAPAADAIAEVRAKRRGSIETVDQEAIIAEYARLVGADKPWSPMTPGQEAAVVEYERRLDP